MSHVADVQSLGLQEDGGAWKEFFWARCTCGWFGPRRPSWMECWKDVRQHEERAMHD